MLAAHSRSGPFVNCTIYMLLCPGVSPVREQVLATSSSGLCVEALRRLWQAGLCTQLQIAIYT